MIHKRTIKIIIMLTITNLVQKKLQQIMNILILILKIVLYSYNS